MTTATATRSQTLTAEIKAAATLENAKEWNDDSEQWMFVCDLMDWSNCQAEVSISRLENRFMKLLQANGITVK